MKQGNRLSAGDAKRWDKVVKREIDLSFVYAVTTTGVYCRSHCPSRRAFRKNVSFFDTAIAAEVAGFRPCKRCRPDDCQPADSIAHRVAEMCLELEESAREPSLQELAGHVGFSASHAHRVFSRLVGLSPKAYRTAVLRRRVQTELSEQPTVTRAAYSAGWASSSRFYERALHLLGMSPSEYRSGAPGLRVRFAVGECTLGAFLVAATSRGVCAVYLGDDPAALISDLEQRFRAAELLAGDQAFERIVAQVVAAIESQSSAKAFGLGFDIQSTAFQEKVYRALQEIPRGDVISYSELARRIGAPTATRAVASACAKNELAVLVPCHRVVRLDGGLSGYRWGIERKRELLARERENR